MGFDVQMTIKGVVLLLAVALDVMSKNGRSGSCTSSPGDFVRRYPGGVRRFLLSGTFLSAVIAGVNLLRKTLIGPRDWRTLLLWASWAISLVLAIAAINDRRLSVDDED